MFESKNEPLLSTNAFFFRMGSSFLYASLIAAASLLVGSAGYHYFGALPWIDALLNAAMILTGMGPVDPMHNLAGKLFATFYSLYSGIAFLTIMAVMLGPIIHRLLHNFHIDDETDDAPEE